MTTMLHADLVRLIVEVSRNVCLAVGLVRHPKLAPHCASPLTTRSRIGAVGTGTLW